MLAGPPRPPTIFNNSPTFFPPQLSSQVGGPQVAQSPCDISTDKERRFFCLRVLNVNAMMSQGLSHTSSGHKLCPDWKWAFASDQIVFPQGILILYHIPKPIQ